MKSFLGTFWILRRGSVCKDEWCTFGSSPEASGVYTRGQRCGRRWSLFSCPEIGRAVRGLIGFWGSEPQNYANQHERRAKLWSAEIRRIGGWRMCGIKVATSNFIIGTSLGEFVLSLGRHASHADDLWPRGAFTIFKRPFSRPVLPANNANMHEKVRRCSGLELRVSLAGFDDRLERTPRCGFGFRRVLQIHG